MFDETFSSLAARFPYPQKPPSYFLRKWGISCSRGLRFGWNPMVEPARTEVANDLIFGDCGSLTGILVSILVRKSSITAFEDYFLTKRCLGIPDLCLSRVGEIKFERNCC